MKKYKVFAAVLIAVLLVSVILSACGENEAPKASEPATAAATVVSTTAPETVPVTVPETEAETPTEPETDPEPEEETDPEEETMPKDLQELMDFFKEQKELQVKSMEVMVARSQYESFDVRDFSKYGVWEYEAWHWTDSYDCEYQWPSLYKEGTKEEKLLLESDDGHLIQMTYYGEMLRKMDLGPIT